MLLQVLVRADGEINPPRTVLAASGSDHPDGEIKPLRVKIRFYSDPQSLTEETKTGWFCCAHVRSGVFIRIIVEEQQHIYERLRVQLFCLQSL